jgi:hypothetical protein
MVEWLLPYDHISFTCFPLTGGSYSETTYNIHEAGHVRPKHVVLIKKQWNEIRQRGSTIQPLKHLRNSINKTENKYYLSLNAYFHFFLCVLALVLNIKRSP